MKIQIYALPPPPRSSFILKISFELIIMINILNFKMLGLKESWVPVVLQNFGVHCYLINWITFISFRSLKSKILTFLMFQIWSIILLWYICQLLSTQPKKIDPLNLLQFNVQTYFYIHNMIFTFLTQ